MKQARIVFLIAAIISFIDFSCTKTLVVSAGIPIDTNSIKIIRIDTATIGPEKILTVHYRTK